MLVSLYALFVLAAPPVSDGTWLPTSGPGGEQPILALGVGGEGALYAVGAGQVHRLLPGEAWRTVGIYAPTLRWTGDEHVEAEGPFDAAFLERVAEDAEASIETATGLELTDANLTEDLVEGLLEAYVEESEPSPDSPWAVAGMVPAKRGVWLATGGGLFRVGVDGVRGPIGDLAPIIDLALTSTGLVALTPQGVYRVDDDGRAELWLSRPVRDLATRGGNAVLVTDEGLLLEVDDTRLGRIAPPTGRPRLAVGDDPRLWVATELALYRYESGSWTLCPALPQNPTRLDARDGVLVATTPEALYVTGADCAEWARFPLPWPGGTRFNDGMWYRSSLWGATSEGAFALGPPDDAAQAELKASAFRRAVAALPRFEALVEAALEYQGLDWATNSYGYRPILAGLLPDLRFRVTDSQRFPLSDLRIDETDYRVMALWTVELDILTALFEAEQSTIELRTETTETAVLETDELEEIDDVETIEEVVTIDTGEAADFGDLESVALIRLAAERRQLRRDRRWLVETLRRLYRERMRLMHRLWLGGGAGDPQELVMRMREIDGALSGLTGGAYRQLTK